MTSSYCSTAADGQATIALSLLITCMHVRALLKPSDVTPYHWGSGIGEENMSRQPTGIVIFSILLTYGRSPWDIFTRKMEETFTNP